MNSMPESDQEKEWNEKYQDVKEMGITSVHWAQILQIIKYLEGKEEYEKCQVLWTYYLKVTGQNKTRNNGKRKI